MSTRTGWSGVKPSPSVPKTVTAIRSESHSDFEYDLEPHSDGSFWLITTRQFRAGEPYRFFDKARLTDEKLGRWKEKIDRQFEAMNCDPDFFTENEETQGEQTDAA